MEAGARPGTLWFLRIMACSSQRVDSKRPITRTFVYSQAGGWRGLTCRAWAWGYEGFSLFFLRIFVVWGYSQSPGALYCMIYQVLLVGKQEQK